MCPLHTYLPEVDTISFRYISFLMACQGDSGGAAIWEGEEEHRSFVIGNNDSGGVDCAVENNQSFKIFFKAFRVKFQNALLQKGETMSKNAF